MSKRALQLKKSPIPSTIVLVIADIGLKFLEVTFGLVKRLSRMIERLVVKRVEYLFGGSRRLEQFRKLSLC